MNFPTGDNNIMKTTKSFLLIEDDREDRKAIRRILNTEMPGAEILEANSCTEGMSEMASKEFDCILLDYQLPDSDGIQFLNKLMMGEFHHPPVLFLTGQGDEALAVQALKSGAADYIPKNILSAELLSRSIDNAIRCHKLEIRAKEAELTLSNSEEKYRNIVEKISDLVFQLDSDKNFIFANSAFAMLGYEPEDLLGTPIENLIETSNMDSILPELATRQVGPLATNNLEIRFKTCAESSLCEAIPNVTVLVDSFGMWDVADEMVFKEDVGKKFLGTLCIGRNIRN